MTPSEPMALMIHHAMDLLEWQERVRDTVAIRKSAVSQHRDHFAVVADLLSENGFQREADEIQDVLT